MKPHLVSPLARRFISGCSTGLVFLVSACSTFTPAVDSDFPADSGDAAAAIAAAEPEADPVSAGRARLIPGPRPPVKRIARPRAADSVDPSASADREPPVQGLQTLIDTVPEDVGDEKAPVAGPVPKLEPLAEYANRPYRLRGRKYRPMTQLAPYRQRGVASWYGKPFHGRRTAIGERYNMHAMTAAHPTLPLPSYVRVTNLRNGTSVIVRVNDRGPFAHDRVIDLSHAAARHLGVLQGGIAAVELNLIVPEPAGTVLPSRVAELD